MSEPQAAVELYLYYRAAEGSAEAVRSAFERLRGELLLESPALCARLLRRPESRDGQHTWMEIYRRDGGIDAALEARIEAVAAQAFAAVTTGPRQRERFIACA